MVFFKTRGVIAWTELFIFTRNLEFSSWMVRLIKLIVDKSCSCQAAVKNYLCFLNPAVGHIFELYLEMQNGMNFARVSLIPPC